MSPLSIRLIQKTDNAAVAAIIRSVMTSFGAVGAGYSIEDPEVDKMYEAYNQDRAAMYVVVDDISQEVLGCGGYAPLTGAGVEVCELRKMYFLPASRGKGMGRKMLETILKATKREAYTHCYLETLDRMQKANQLYQKAGFMPILEPMGNTGHCACDRYYLREL